MNCHQCGADNPDSHAYCTQCGTALRPVAAPAPPVPGRTVEPRPLPTAPPPGPDWSGVRERPAGLLSMGLHVGLTAAAIGVMVIGLAVLVCGGVAQNGWVIVLGALLHAAGGVAYTVMLLIHVYKTWAAIQDGYARTGPGKAVGFLFIPFFNIYWMFPAIYGFAKDYNAHVERRGMAAPPLPKGLHLTYCILACCSMIPYLGVLPFLAGAGVWLFGILPRNIAAVNRLVRHG